MSPSLFDPGLEHISVAETRLSDLDGETGDLVVGGYPIEELAAEATYEEACYLLLHDRLPTSDELDAFRADLAAARSLDDDVTRLLRRAGDEGKSAMTALRWGVAAADLGRQTTSPIETATRLVAVVPTVVATYWRSRDGRDPVAPDPDLGHAANYHYMLTGVRPGDAVVRGLETFLTTVLEHGLNPSTFAARVVASTEADLVSAVTAAVGALNGPRHGRLETVFDVLRAVHEAEDAETALRDRIDDGSLPGFGHRVYRVRDPRAAVMAAAAERLYDATEDDFLGTVRTVERAGRDLLAERHPDRHTAPTVEFYAAALLRGLEVPPALFTATFGVGRTGGWVAHCLEQLDTDQVLRPNARYVGDEGRSWTPVEKRHTVGDRLVGRPPRSGSLKPVSETLATLSEANRLEILLVLYDGDAPMRYSDLRSATTIDDKGRFNYHLRQLREFFVVDGEDGYALTDAGRALVDAIVTDDRLLGPRSD